MTRLVHCARCHRAIKNARPLVTPIYQRVLRALGTGPRTIGQLAHGIYGSDTPYNCRRASKQLTERCGDLVEPVPGKRGTWRLWQHYEQGEAAE